VRGLAAVALWASLAIPAVAGAADTRRAAFEGFVQVNGVRLQYLDWGGKGPALIFIHGVADTPHVFDDLAPAFTDRFHVIAYATRGSGNSDVIGPYDASTLTDDLCGLMDALQIPRANLVGYSASGNEVTEMAAEHPARVASITYLDGGYDWSDPDFEPLVKALPMKGSEVPPGGMASVDAFLAYQKQAVYPGLDDMRRIEANLRERVIIQRDGSVKYRVPTNLIQDFYAAMWSNKPREYTRVTCPVLAIYATSVYDLHVANLERRAALRAYENAYWQPFQRKAIARVRREIAHVQIAQVPGAHVSFTLTERAQIVRLMRRFLVASPGAKANGPS
jgi:pimeloyl-ACP methyl ester carboxylesterase